MNIRAKQDYWDNSLDRIVKKGESLDVTKERSKALIDLGYAEKDSYSSTSDYTSEGDKPYGTSL